MPKNNNLEPVTFPQVFKFDKEQETEFEDNLKSIKVTLIDHTPAESLLAFMPQFVEATWAETPDTPKSLSLSDKHKIVRSVFKGQTLPTALETVNLVFQIEGISMQEVTHILRHRNASFSADCSGDKWWTDKRGLVPEAVANSPEFIERYKELVIATKQLYCDMIDSRQISIMDARYILPRCLETFYFMRMNLGDTLRFIQQRIDRQIQPATDNVLAYAMYLELLKAYPFANGLVDVDAPAMHFVKTARSGKSTNLYFPESNSDLFEWNEKDFIYPCERREMRGTNGLIETEFERQLEKYRFLIKEQEAENLKALERRAVDTKDW